MNHIRFICIFFSIFFCQVNAAYINITVEGTFHSMDPDCLIISSLKIPSKVNQCTLETFVHYVCGKIEKSGFLAKNMNILQQTSVIECQDDLVDSVETGLFAIQKIGNNVLVKLKNKSFFYAIEFIKNFFNDTNDYCYLFLILVMIVIDVILFVWFKYIFNKKQSVEPCDVSINKTKSVIGGYKNVNKSQSKNKKNTANRNVNKKKLKVKKSVIILLDISCGCKKGCVSSKYCICLKNNQKCTTKCHQGDLNACCNK